MVGINLWFFFLFEREKPKTEDILPIVVVCTGASLGRVIFALIPQVQPVTTLVIIMGSVYGARKGYVTGALCALISNMFLGQGPWTLFQMTAWGIVGFLAGLLGKIQLKNENIKMLLFTIYSFFAAFLFSIISDLSTISYLGDALTISSAAAVFATGIVFNIGHASANVILMIFFYGIISKKLRRIKEK
jgi:energy-coupling factor transport system substrate-specific component